MTRWARPSGDAVPPDWSQFFPDLVSGLLVGALVGIAVALYIRRRETSDASKQAEKDALAEWRVARSSVMDGFIAAVTREVDGLREYVNQYDGVLAETSSYPIGSWSESAPPSVYSVWAARLGTRDSVAKMVEEARVLTETYSNGVGIYAFRVNDSADGYTPATLTTNVSNRVTSLDNVLGYIAADIRRIMRENNDAVPAPVTPPEHTASGDV